MPTRGDKFAVVYVDGDVPQLPIQLGQLLVDSSLVSPGTTNLQQCTSQDPLIYEDVSGGGGGGGTVTSIAAGTGIAATPDPITTTGTIALSAASITSLGLADTAVQPARTLTAGAGLTGGGNLSADRTFDVGAGTGITVNTNDVALSAATITSLGLADTAVQPARTLTAGAGLTGGGTLAADRTFDVGAGTGITVNANDVAIADTAVTPGTYTFSTLTVDQQGRLTAASSGSAPAFQDETIRYGVFGGAATPDTVGLVLTSAGTDQTPTMADTTAFTRQPRRRRITSTAGNQVAGYRASSTDQFPNRSLGFQHRVLFGSVSNAAGQRLLVGSNSTGVSILAANDPSTEVDFFAFAKDVADTNLQFMHNDSTGTATKVDLGFTWASLSGVLLLATFSCTPAASGITYSLRNCNTGAVIASGTVTSNIPAVGVFVGPQCFVGNAATAAAVSMEAAYIDSRTRFP